MEKDFSLDLANSIHSIQIILRVLFSQLNRSQQERWGAIKKTQSTKDKKHVKIRYYDILEKVNQIIGKHNIQVKDFANVFIVFDNNKQISLLKYKNQTIKKIFKINWRHAQIYIDLIIKGQIQVNSLKKIEDQTLKKQRNKFILSKFPVQTSQQHLIVFLYAQPLVISVETQKQKIIKRKEYYVENRDSYCHAKMPVSSSQQLKRICKALEGEKNVRLEVLLATHLNIQKALSMNPTILHFSCHGNQDFLEIESDPSQHLGYTDLLLYENLISYIKANTARKLKFIVFNACDSFNIAKQINKQLNEITTISFKGKVANSACQDLCEDFYSIIFYRKKLENFIVRPQNRMQQDQFDLNKLANFMQYLELKYKFIDTNQSKRYYFMYQIGQNSCFKSFFLPQQNYLPSNPNFALIQDKFQIERWNQHLAGNTLTKLYDFIKNYFFQPKQESLYYWTFGQQNNKNFLNKAVEMVTRRKIYNKKYQIYCDHQDNGIIRTLVEFKIKHKSILKKFISQNKHDKIIIIINNCHQLIQSQPHETYEYFRKVQLKNHSGRLILVADNFQRLKMHVHHSQIEYKLEEKAKENKKVYNIQDKNNIILQGIFNYLRERLQKSQQLLKKALKSQTLFVPENELFLNPQLRYFPQVNEGRDNQIDQRQIVSYLQLQVALHKSSKILRFLTQLLWLININQQVELHLSKPKNTEILIVLKVQKQQNFQNKFQSQKDGHFLLSVQQFQLDDKFFNYLKQLIKINKLRQIEQKNYLKIKLSTKQHKIKPILLFQTLNKLTVIFGIANILDRQSLKKNNLQNELFNAYKLVKKANYFNKLKPLCPKNLLQILEIKIFILFYSLFNKLKEQNTKQIYHQLAKQGKLRLVFSKEKQQSKINLSDILKILERQFKKQHEQSIILQKIKSLNEVLKQSNNKNQTKSKDKLKNNCSTQEEIYKITSKLTKLLQYFGDIEFLVKKANQLLAEPLAESLQKIQSQQKQGQAHEIFFSQLQIHIYHLQGFNILSNLMKEIKIINQIFLSKQNQKQTKLILKNVCRLRGYFIKIDQKIDAFNKENSSLKFLKNYNQLLSQYCWSKLFIEKIYLLLENRHQRQTDVFLEMMEKLQLWEILQLQSLKGFYQQVIAFSTSYIDPKCHILVSQPISQFNKKNKKKQQKQQKQKNQRQSTYRFYNSLAYNIKETVEQKIDRFANISIQSLTLQKLINLPLENKKHALNVIFCDSLMPQHKEEEQKFQEKIQNQQIILQNQLGNFHVQRIDKILQKLKKRQLTQRQKKQSSQNNDQTVVNVLFGKNVEVLKTIVKKLFQKREKNIIITLNLSQKQPFSKGQGFKTNFIKTWQCFVQKQRSSYFFTQFFIKFYKNFFIQKLTTKYSLFQQSFYKAKKHAKQSLQAEFKSIFPQLKWKNIQFGIQGLQTAQKQLERSLVGNQKITPEKPSNIEFFHIKEIGLNQIISQSMKNLTKKMQEIIKSRQPFRNFVVVSQQKQVQDIESKSKYEQNLKIFVKSIFLMLIKQKKYVDKVSLQMNNSILQNYQKQQFFFNSQNQKKNLFQIEIIYDKILIEQKKDIHEKQKYYRQRFISSKGQPQKYLKIIVLNCLNISYKSYSGPQFKLESNQTQQLQFLFKIQWIGSIYHFCYPIFKLYKAQKISFDMKKWMKKFVNNSNYKYLLTTFNKQNAHYSLQYQHIVNTVFQQIIKENKIPNNKQKKNE